LKLKFLTVAEKTAKNFRGYFILPRLVHLLNCIVTDQHNMCTDASAMQLSVQA